MNSKQCTRESIYTVYNYILAAVCPLGCLHGDCTAPNNCTCHQHYEGARCDQVNIIISSQLHFYAVICFDSAYYSFPGECSPVFSSWWVLAWRSLCQSRDMLLSFRVDWKKVWNTYMCIPYISMHAYNKKKWVFWHCGWITHPDFYVVASILQMNDKLLTEIGTLSHSS